MTHKLLEKLSWESIRIQESHGIFHTNLDQANQLASSLEKSFTEQLSFRADYLDNNHIIKGKLKQLFKRSGLITVLVLFTSLCLGALATSALINNEERILNFYWLVIALLGLHGITFLFWLFSVLFFDIPSPINFIWQQLHTWLQPRIKARNTTLNNAINVDKSLDQSTFYSWSHYFSVSKPGKWWFYTVMHSYWFFFLLGALIYIVAVMSTRQYQFIWETTILPKHWFSHLTEWLAWLPETLGFSVPSTTQITNSQLTPTIESATSWASLLAASIILYGLLPRAISILYCFIFYKQSSRQWLPDFKQPYYRRLRNQLTPQTSQIVDADEQAPEFDELPLWENSDIALNHNEHYAMIGLEMHEPPKTWPIDFKQAVTTINAGIINDSGSFNAVKSLIEFNHYDYMIIACHLNTLPDRGLLRIIKSLVAHQPTQALLVLSKNNLRIENGDIKQRFDDWLQVAIQAGLQAKDVIIYDFE